jgi:predicted DsbA family dithiol-disulfide isomerase
MANRAEQKAAARAAREARQQRLSAAQTRRRRLIWLGGLAATVVVALVVVIVASSGGGGGPTPAVKRSSIETVERLIDGIPESGNTLGKPKAPVTITEYADIVCPVCHDFAVSSESQVIAAEVRTGHAKLVFRGFETASGFANAGEYTDTQVAIRSAGMQHRAWYYILLAFEEQPANEEDVSYITPGYLQDLATQVPGLNLVDWQAGMTNQTLINEATTDTLAAHAAGVNGTPAIIVSGAGGSVFYDRNEDPNVSAVPSLATVQQLITQVS